MFVRQLETLLKMLGERVFRLIDFMSCKTSSVKGGYMSSLGKN